MISPLQYFMTFFGDDIIDLIIAQTNLYSTQEFGKCIDTNHDEIETSLGVELMMGVVHLPAYTDYWAEETRWAPVADILPIKRYQVLRRNLHFANSERNWQ